MIICPQCGSGKHLTEIRSEFSETNNNLTIHCWNQNCDWIGETDDLAEGEGDETRN